MLKMKQVQVVLGRRSGGCGIYKVREDKWVACESRLPEPGRWVCLIIRWNGRTQYYAARLGAAGKVWITFGFIEHRIRIEKFKDASWWTELPEWWEGFKDA